MSAIAQPDSAKHDRLLQAGVLALLVHVGFFIFMTFGFNWKTHPPEGVVVDLWSSLPEPPKPPVQKVKPLPPKPVQPPKKVKPLPPKPEKPTAPTKPDIALKKEKIKKPTCTKSANTPACNNRSCLAESGCAIALIECSYYSFLCS